MSLGTASSVLFTNFFSGISYLGGTTTGVQLKLVSANVEAVVDWVMAGYYSSFYLNMSLHADVNNALAVSSSVGSLFLVG